MDATSKAKYLHGHHESVLRSHSWRTAANSCAYLLPYLNASMHILDIGSGPGTITCDLASIASEGSATGLDQSESVVETARATAVERGVKNVKFEVGDVYKLQYPDQTFDVVHAHQVLQHLSDPVKALKEMRRVTKKGGIIASRETDLSTAVWYPEHPVMNDWQDCYLRTAKGTGGNPHAGRMHHVFAKEAGLSQDEISISASANCYGNPEARRFWCEMWADRMESSPLRKNILDGGYSTPEKLDQQVNMWREFANKEDAQFTLVHGELICKIA